MTGAKRKPASLPLVWRAAADQIAHCHVMRRDTLRTLCGLRIVDHRLAWPPVVRCPDCLVKAGVKGVSQHA